MAGMALLRTPLPAIESISQAFSYKSTTTVMPALSGDGRPAIPFLAEEAEHYSGAPPP